MPIINYDKPIFWKPSNAMGVSAQISGLMDNIPIKIFLYWSGMLLSTNKAIDQAAMNEQTSNFMKKFMPMEGEMIFHFEFDGEGFKKIVDPHWVPGME